MSMTTARKLERIRRYSISLRRLARLLLVVTLLGAAISLLLILVGRWAAPVNIIGIRFSGIASDGTVRAVAALTVVLTAGIVAKFYFHSIKLFGLYAEGVLFTAESVAHIRQIGVTLLLVPAVWLVGALGALILGSQATADAGIALVSAPMGQLVSGIIVIFVSWLMDLARELREEQDLVV